GEYHSALPLPDSFRVSGSGVLALHGDFSNLQTLAGTLDLHALHVSSGGLDLKSKNDAHLQLRERAVPLSPVAFFVGGSDLSMSGEGTLDGSVQVRSEGTLAAEAIQPFVPHLETLSGAVPIRLQIGGSLSDLELTGRATTEHTRLKFDFLDDTFS